MVLQDIITQLFSRSVDLYCSCNQIRQNYSSRKKLHWTFGNVL